MKNLFGILAILLLSTSVFGQAFIRNRSFVETSPTGNNTIEDAINRDNFHYTNFDWISYIHFIKNGKLYLLSYEPVENYLNPGCRDIYLYSKDLNNLNSPWEKASAAIMTNCYGTQCYDEVDFFLAEKSFGSKGNVEIKDDCIEITIGWSVMNKVTNSCDGSELKYTFVHNPYGRVEYLHERIYE